MDQCSKPGLLSLADALAQMQSAIAPVAEREYVPLLSALDRVSAEAIFSSIPVPGYDNAAMDGYALRYADIADHPRLQIAGQSLAGQAFSGAIKRGECVRIMTGAVIPEGADTVVMQENVVPSGAAISLTLAPNAGDNIRRAGEDIACGTLVFPQGHRIGPVDIGLLASLGIAGLEVYRKVRVAVLATGDELIPPGQPLLQGHIYDSNRYALMALLQRLNLEVIDLGLIPDQAESIVKAFAIGTAAADAVISSGGVSVGDADHTKAALEQIGSIDFWKIAIKPGKPFAFGRLNKSGLGAGWFFGLPGNPVSAVVTYHQLVLPALRQLAGERVQAQTCLNALASHNLKKQAGRRDFQRGLVRSEKGINLVSTTGNQSSGVLTSMAQANCYIDLAQDAGSVAEGEIVQIQMFDRFLR